MDLFIPSSAHHQHMTGWNIPYGFLDAGSLRRNHAQEIMISVIAYSISL
jgi:hypothetical protein